MKSSRPTFVIVGGGLALTMCAAYLVEKLQHLNPVVIGVCMPAGQREADLAFAFPPYAEPLAPSLKGLLAAGALNNVSISTTSSPSGFAFNFGPYGIVSGAITFPHAYEICKKFAADVPSYDSFLGVQPPPSPGALYVREALAPDFQYIATRKRVALVPAESVSFSVSEGEHKILSLKTASGQLIEGDIFIDCTPGGLVMQQLQNRSSVASNIIPSWGVARAQQEVLGSKSSYQLALDKERAECVGEFGGKRYIKAYDFSAGLESAEYFAQPWLGNCIVLGQGFLQLPELLIDLDRILERQLTILSWLLGVNASTTYAARHFNHVSMRHMSEAVDTVNLLLQATRNAQIELTESNRRRAHLFMSSANTVKEDNLLISESAWTGLLHAVGLTPKNTNAVSLATDSKRIFELTKSLLVR